MHVYYMHTTIVLILQNFQNRHTMLKLDNNLKLLNGNKGMLAC